MTDASAPRGKRADVGRTDRYAYQEGVATLFKFRRYTTPDQRQWVREILVDHKIRFARASELNDDRDLRPLLEFRCGATDAETRSRLFENAEQVWARQQPPFTAEHLERMRSRLRTESIEQLTHDALERTHWRLESHYWILSFASSRDWVRMWNEYADQATGLCIHFKSDSSSPFGLAQRVLYAPERPRLYVPLDPDQGVIVDACMLTKTTKWEYELEYRVIRYPDVDYSPIGLRFDGQHAYFPATALMGITVGLNMSAEHVQAILVLVGAHDPPLPVWKPNGDVIVDRSK